MSSFKDQINIASIGGGSGIESVSLVDFINSYYKTH